MKAILTNFRYASHGFRYLRLQALPLHFLLLPLSRAAVSSLTHFFMSFCNMSRPASLKSVDLKVRISKILNLFLFLSENV